MTAFQQADDFRAECDALAKVLEPLRDEQYETKTLFKDWTLHDVIAHLHIFNWAADVSIHQPKQLDSFKEFQVESRKKGLDLRGLTDEWLGEDRNRAVYLRWRDYYPEMCERLDGVDPRQRAEWFGPSMSVRSSITARQMETWAHGQEVFDVLGLERLEEDRIKNIVFLGLNTFGWTYAVRELAVPNLVPQLRLTAPSGEIWQWNETETTNKIEGSAFEFCQVVAQTRNIADTRLRVSGEVAIEWMRMAQCFAGAAQAPPPAGARHKAETTSA